MTCPSEMVYVGWVNSIDANQCVYPHSRIKIYSRELVGTYFQRMSISIGVSTCTTQILIYINNVGRSRNCTIIHCLQYVYIVQYKGWYRSAKHNMYFITVTELERQRIGHVLKSIYDLHPLCCGYPAKQLFWDHTKGIIK